MSVKREIKYFALWFFWGPVGGLVQTLPFGVVCGAARFLGGAVFLFYGRARAVVRGELGRLFPGLAPREVRCLAARTFQNWCLAEFENMLQAKWRRDGFYEHMQICGRDRLDGALARGQGAILLIAHFGAHLQVLPALGFNGYRVNQLTNRRPVDGPDETGAPAPGFFERRYYAAQEKRHGSVLPANMIVTGGFMRPLFDRLKHNEIVVIAIDGRAEGRLAPYPFLGCDSYSFSHGPMALALKTGAAVVPAFVVRGKDRRNIMMVEKEIALDSQKAKEDEIRSKTAAFVSLLEQAVREHPDHCGMEFFGERRRPPAGMPPPDES